MADNAHYYLAALVCIVLACVIVKRTASCLVRSLVLLALAALLALIAYLYFGEGVDVSSL